MAEKIEWGGVAAAIARGEERGTVVGAAVIAPGGERFGHKAGRRFVAASTVKVPLMIALFRRVEAGGHSLAETYRLRNEDRAPGSGVMLHLHEGMELTVGDLVYLMISISDNTATNILIDMVGMEEVNAVMASLGMTGSTLGRKMQARAAGAGQKENWASPEDYARVIEALLKNEAASAGSCAAMVAMLEKQQNERRIARYLPKADRPRWGSKTGSVPGVCNDVGFVMTGKGALIVSVFCEGESEPYANEQVIGEISRAALEAVGS
ncbi:MAG TPA: serine hydrolase [Acetobacteraceae bacterium]|nr:serine hydrolase [Acetobacteraceae bacterium]